ncbi:hypothetical protein [Nonlabens sp.]|uniref:hypothetical protein n=1 Tax=Nonlabens sp. TaxID=1888209 RepID=UPI001BCCCDC4|nr:hypothetical protein [Nonlabens sp.]
MNKSVKKGYAKRTQKDYSLSFKLQIVEEVSLVNWARLSTHLKYGIQARSAITTWLKKDIDTFDWENLSVVTMAKHQNKES